MTAEQRNQEATRVADFRYAIIAELANPYLNPRGAAATAAREIARAL